MSGLSFLPTDARLTEYLPGRWHVQLEDGLPLFSVMVVREAAGGWLTLQGSLPHAGGPSALIRRSDLAAPFDLLEQLRGLRLALPDTEGGLELRADVPLPAGARGPALDAWQTWVFEHFVETRRHLCAAAHGAFDAVVEASAEVPREAVEPATVAQLAVLGELADAGPDHPLRLQVPLVEHPLVLDVTQSGGWLRLEALADAGAVAALREPCGRALHAYLLRVAGRLRMARPLSRRVGEPEQRQLGFRVDLPATAAAVGLEAAVEALATAMSLFGAEIDQLAGEVILADAYLAVSGSTNGAAPSNREL